MDVALSRHTANQRAAGLTLGAVVITALLDESIQWYVDRTPPSGTCPWTRPAGGATVAFLLLCQPSVGGLNPMLSLCVLFLIDELISAETSSNCQPVNVWIGRSICRWSVAFDRGESLKSDRWRPRVYSKGRFRIRPLYFWRLIRHERIDLQTIPHRQHLGTPRWHLAASYHRELRRNVDIWEKLIYGSSDASIVGRMAPSPLPRR
jgi:hypothetical protein